MTYRSIRSAAGEFGISQLSVRRPIRQGRIPAVEIGGVWRIPSSYLEEFESHAHGSMIREDVVMRQRPRPLIGPALQFGRAVLRLMCDSRLRTRSGSCR